MDLLSLPNLVFGFLTGGTGLVVPAAGAAFTVLGSIWRGWGKWVLLLLAFLALGSWGAANRVKLADQVAETAELGRQLEAQRAEVTIADERMQQARATIARCVDLGRHNDEALARLKADQAAAAAALGRAQSRALAESRQAEQLSRRIDALNVQCRNGAIPDSILAVPQWMRDNPE